MLSLAKSSQLNMPPRLVVKLSKVRKQTVNRTSVFVAILASTAILQFFYTCYKYFFYSADCNPRNKLSLEVNSLLSMIGTGVDYLFWLFPIVVFFWPTKAHEKIDRLYRSTKKRFSESSSSGRPTI